MNRAIPITVTAAKNLWELIAFVFRALTRSCLLNLVTDAHVTHWLLSKVAHGSLSCLFRIVPRSSQMKIVTSLSFALGLSLFMTPTANAQYRGAARPPAVRPPAVRPTAPMPKPSAPTVSPKPVAPAAKTAITPSRTATVAPKATNTVARPPATPRVQGNSLSSNKPQQLYGIFGTNTNTGKTSLYKYGVSGGASSSGGQLPSSMQRSQLAPSRDYSNRALQQVKQLNKQAQATGQPMKYSTRTLQRVPSQPSGSSTARQSVIAAEKQAVTKHTVNRGSVPAGNTLPNPAPFSRVKK